jgi:adenylosuccinate synthase
MVAGVLLLSGRIASGKSSLAQGLSRSSQAVLVSTSELLKRAATENGIDLKDRRALQEFGTAKDRDTDGQWLADALQIQVDSARPDQFLVVDAVRLSEQIVAIRSRFGRLVTHVHLTAFEADLVQRYNSRARATDRSTSFAAASSDLTERQVETLAPIADLHINTSTSAPEDVVVRCLARMGRLSSLDSRLVDVLVGGQYGSEGKGNIAYYLAPEYDVLLRVGGPNAGHKVPTEPVVTHRSLPSGALSNPAAPLLIGPGATVSPSVLLAEIADSGVDPSRVHIDPQATVISGSDVKSERPLKVAIGSTGQGVGAAISRRIRDRSTGKVQLAKDVPALQPFVKEPVVDLLEEAYAANRRVLLEGTQGAGLSLYHGNYPYVTSRDTSAAGCLAEAGIGFGRVRRVVMVIRTFPIRVQGSSGPMGREISWQEVARRSGFDVDDLTTSEKSSVQRKLRRVAEFDWRALRMAAQLNTPTDLALTFADYLNAKNSLAYRYDQLQVETREFVEEIEAVASAPVSLISGRFTDRSVIDRRRWRGHLPGTIGG